MPIPTDPVVLAVDRSAPIEPVRPTANDFLQPRTPVTEEPSLAEHQVVRSAPAEPPVIPLERRHIASHLSTLASAREVVVAEANEHVRETVVWLAAAFAVVAMIGMVPPMFQFLDFVNQPNPPEIPRWVYVVSTAGLLQFALSIYLMQLPDWSSLWVATIGMLIVAAGYALFTGVTLSASPSNSVVEMLDLAAELTGRRAAGWCLAMLAQTGILTYICGRVAARSRHVG